MNRRRVLVFSAVLAVPLAAIAVACSFPGVTFAELGNDDGGPNNNTPDTTTPRGPDADADASVEPEYDGGAVDAAKRLDAEQVITDKAVCLTKTPCDCDEDGYRDERCAADPADAGFEANVDLSKLGRFDCDDLDPVRHPDAGFREDVPDPATKPPPPGDWDCSGKADRLPPILLRCTSAQVLGVGVLLGYDCTGGGSGYYLAEPGCGTRATVFECPNSGRVSKPEECVPVARTPNVPAGCK